MDQNWFYRGNALIHSLSEQETTSHSVAVWRIGQCGVFLKYNGKIILRKILRQYPRKHFLTIKH